MFRISDFSRLTRVTIKTLRHYDRLGLLAPVFVDPATRYRYYAAHQVTRLHRIRALRDLGFTLEHIAYILDDDPGGRTLKRLLERRREEITGQIEEDARRLAQLEATLIELDRKSPALPDAVVHEVAPVRVMARRARVADLDDGAQALFEAVEADAATARIRSAGPPLLIYHDRDHREIDADIEAAVPVVADADDARSSALRTLPGHSAAACMVYRGDYVQWAGVARGLMAWMEARQLEPTGPVREVYLQFSAGEPARRGLPPQFIVTRREDLLTEMQIPVRSVLNRGR
jgi:DNA-binding transcriptional MerR regulator